MITAKNYSAACERGFMDLAKQCGKMQAYYSQKNMFVLADVIRDSVHFAIPDNGLIFDDELKGMRGRPLRLPYPKLTVEFFSPRPDNFAPDGCIGSSKSVAIAQEMNRSK